MNVKIISLTIATWFLFMILAIINAIVRNGVYKSIVGEQTAHQISTFIFIALILLTTYLILKFLSFKLTDSEAFFIGFIWLILTVMFEFIAGHYVFGNSWDKLFADYNILKGRIWSFVLVTTFFAPYITSKLV